MRKIGIAVVMLTIIVAGLRLRAIAADKPALPTAAVAAIKDAPKIDGVLDDAAWKDATELKDLKTPDESAPKIKTSVKVARDDKNIYFAVECFEPTPKKILADVTEHNGNVWEDDSVEFFIDPAGTRKTYYHIVINSKNVTMDATHKAGDDAETTGTPSMDWKPKYTSAAKVGDKSWVVEVAIPVDQFTQTATASDTWTFNFLRNRNSGDDAERTYWSPIAGSAHSPDKFGTLTGMPTWKDRAVVAPKKADGGFGPPDRFAGTSMR